jgi:hypothetical protein
VSRFEEQQAALGRTPNGHQQPPAEGRSDQHQVHDSVGADPSNRGSGRRLLLVSGRRAHKLARPFFRHDSTNSVTGRLPNSSLPLRKTQCLSRGVDVQSIRKTMLAITACGLVAAGASSADAKGCLKGAVVGGVAGHMAGHGAMGAAGGCAVGHHMANKADGDGDQRQSQQQYSPNYDQNRR